MLVTLAGTGLLGVRWATGPALSHQIDEAGLAHIRPGMARQEVESILGVPPGDYHRRADEVELYVAHMAVPATFTMSSLRLCRKHWISDLRVIAIDFDRDTEMVVRVVSAAVPRCSLFTRLRWRLGL